MTDYVMVYKDKNMPEIIRKYYDGNKEFGGVIYGGFEGDVISINKMEVVEGKKGLPRNYYKLNSNEISTFDIVRNYLRKNRIIGEFHNHPLTSQPYPSSLDSASMEAKAKLVKKYLLCILVKYDFNIYSFNFYLYEKDKLPTKIGERRLKIDER